jgi:UDP-2,3-diacylglucosamine hydrolase
VIVHNFCEQQGQNFVAFFLSDIHLRPECPEDIQRLENFIDQLIKEKSKSQLYFLGDIFDFWFCNASPAKKVTLPLLLKLNEYNKNNGSVVFFEGNHDVHLYRSFTKKYGFEVVPNQKVITLLNQKVVLEHGDLFNPEDGKYLFLRKFLRQPWLRFIGTFIVPSFITAAIGDFFSHKSSKFTKVRSEFASQDIKRKFIVYAESQLAIHNADVFIAGHTHERLIQPENNKTIINTGSWFDHKWVLALSADGQYAFVSL